MREKTAEGPVSSLVAVDLLVLGVSGEREGSEKRLWFPSSINQASSH